MVCSWQPVRLFPGFDSPHGYKAIQETHAVILLAYGSACCPKLNNFNRCYHMQVPPIHQNLFSELFINNRYMYVQLFGIKWFLYSCFLSNKISSERLKRMHKPLAKKLDWFLFMINWNGEKTHKMLLPDFRKNSECVQKWSLRNTHKLIFWSHAMIKFVYFSFITRWTLFFFIYY